MNKNNHAEPRSYPRIFFTKSERTRNMLMKLYRELFNRVTRNRAHRKAATLSRRRNRV